MSNVGWDRARISWSDTAGNGDRRSSQCIAVFHNGPLPMKRFAAEEREERFAHNQIPCTSIDVGEFTEWQFEATVPDDWCPKRGNLYVTGFIVYWGSVGNRRATHFCRRYCVKERRFVPVENHPEYESIE